MEDLMNTLIPAAVCAVVLPIAFLLGRGCLGCLVRSLPRKGLSRK